MAVRTKRHRRAEPPDAPAAPPPRGLLLLRRGLADGVLLLDDAQSYVIGRGANADIVFADDAVSRVHAHLKHEHGGWWIADARSANGTVVARAADVTGDETARVALYARAEPLAAGEAHPLAAGDVVFFGDAHAALRATDLLPALNAASSTRSTRGARTDADLARAARGKGPVLLIGPSGAGKTWAARSIHDASGRSGRFVSRNAAALPHDPAQLRSALLGHKKGAFTGAVQDVEGAWFAARDGTLFLDEIDSMPEAAQAFLLTLIEQSGDLSALGAAATDAPRAAVDVRVIAASKTPLAQTALRRDLAYRLLDGAIVELPSLNERREDIPSLIAALLDELKREDGHAVPFADDAVVAARDAEWPGEVRQLRGAVRLLCRTAAEEGRAQVTGQDVTDRLRALERALGSRGPAAPVPTRSVVDARPKKARALTRDDIERALAASEGNIQHAADALGVARNTLRTKMDAFGIARDR